MFFPGILLFEREGANAENPTGSYGPSNVSPDPISGPISGVTLEDPATYPTTVLDVEADVSSNTYDGGANMDSGLPNLTGTDFQLVYSFQFYDADGIFSFSASRDDVTPVDVVPIGGPTDPTAIGTVVSQTIQARGIDNPLVAEFVAGGCSSVAVSPGCAGSLGDYGMGIVRDECPCSCTTWFQVDYNLGGSGWYSATVRLEEDDDNTAKFNGFGYLNNGITAKIGSEVSVFDTDSVSGFSFGSILTGPDPVDPVDPVESIPEPSRAALMLVGLLGAAARRRRRG